MIKKCFGQSHTWKKFPLINFLDGQKLQEMFVVAVATVPNASFLLAVYRKRAVFSLIKYIIIIITKDAQRDLFRFIFRKQIKSKSTQNITMW